MIVCKFGGTSVASAKNIKNIKKILSADSNRKIIVVSAPGKTKVHNKITDLLINLYNEQRPEKKHNILLEIKNIYIFITNKLKINIDINEVLEKTFLNYQTFNYDYLISRGEYLSAKILSNYLNIPFVDSYDFIIFKNNKIDLKKTKKELLKIDITKPFITGGFYGKDEFGNVKLLSRGGSDLTGAIIAKCLNANIYENWTDVDGIYKDINAKMLKKYDTISFKKTKTICQNGAKILHGNVFLYLKKSNCKIIVKNTKNPLNAGSLIC